MMKVVLIGYMGSGKSFIGQLLSEKLATKFIDLDQFIEEEEKNSIKKIFETNGEIYFRKIEHECFKDLMTTDQSFVLSTGGGTPCYADNHKLLSGENIISIYLKTSIEILYQRLILEKDLRPLINNKPENELKEFIAKQLFERSYFYNQANFVIDTGNKSGLEIINEIKLLL
jgi:shikimate kinase